MNISPWHRNTFHITGTWLTHWGRVTHICVIKLTIIVSDNGLSPGRRQAIIWTNDGILLIGPLGTNFSKNSIAILTFSFTKNAIESVVCEIAAILSRPQCVKIYRWPVISPHKGQDCRSFCYTPEQAVEQIVNMPVLCGTLSLMLHCCNGSSPQKGHHLNADFQYLRLWLCRTSGNIANSVFAFHAATVSDLYFETCNTQKT